MTANTFRQLRQDNSVSTRN